MATLGSIFGGTFLATRGGGKQPQGQGAQQGPPVTAGSKDEEKFIQCVSPRFPGLIWIMLYVADANELEGTSLTLLAVVARSRRSNPVVL